MMINDNFEDDDADELIESKDDILEKFEFYEMDTILNFYYDLKSRYSYFINYMQFHDIFDFIIDNRFSQFYGYNYDATIIEKNYFYNKYETEIYNTLYIINDFLKTQDPKIYRLLKINKTDWFCFCYNFTQ